MNNKDINVVELIEIPLDKKIDEQQIKIIEKMYSESGVAPSFFIHRRRSE